MGSRSRRADSTLTPATSAAPASPDTMIQITNEHAAAGHVRQGLAPRGAATHAAGRDYRVTAGLGRAGQLVEDLAERQAGAGPRGVE